MNNEQSLEQPTLEYDKPLSEIQKFDFQDGTPCHFRFVDSNALLKNDRLQIWSFQTLPSDQYIAISYVWDGPSTSESNLNTIEVESIAGCGTINTEILKHVSRFAELKGTKWIWIDCLCIMQLHEKDTDWQIWRMAEIYKNCLHCAILPGGMKRLLKLRLREKSPWIERRWTLQEAILPKSANLLFEWELGTGKINGMVELIAIPGWARELFAMKCF